MGTAGSRTSGARGTLLGAGIERRVSGVLGDALGAWLDVVFVPRCLGCDRTGSHFCGACIGALRPLNRPWCGRCGRSLPDASAGAGCPGCAPSSAALTAVGSAATLEGPLRRAVHRLKYRRRPAAARALADLLVPVADGLALAAGGDAPLVVPVPLDAGRERERGYNQATLLARPLAGRLGWGCAPHLLWRQRPTLPQVGLSRARRRENVRGAFAAGDLNGVDVLLVDDVTTTGSTLTSAAVACVAGGARRVFGVTLARES